MQKAQIFIFDVIIAVSAFVIMSMVLTGISIHGADDNRQEGYSLCLSALESLKGNSTLQLVANGTLPESALNSSLSGLPGRYGYRLDLTAYSLGGVQEGVFFGQSANLTEALLYKDVIAVQSSFVAENATLLLGEAQMRCWVK